MAADDTKDLILRWWTKGDLFPLADLLAEGFPTERWRPADFRAFAAREGADGGPKNILKVLSPRRRPQVYGALLYTLTEGECRIRRLAIRRSLRKRGLGRFAVRCLVDPSSLVRRAHFAARVHEHNLLGQLFFRDVFLPAGGDDRAGRFVHSPGDQDTYEDGTAGYWFRLYREVWTPQPVNVEL